MSSPSPFIPQGSFLARERLQKRARFKVLLFVVLGLHVALLAGLLIQGCNHNHDAAATSEAASTNFSPASSTPPTDTAAFPQVPTRNTLTAPPMPVQTPAAPVIVEPLAPAPTAATKNYRVVKGDTLARVARRHGVSVSTLAQANPVVDPLNLKVGQVLQVPDHSKSEAIAKGRTNTATSNGQRQGAVQLYTVKGGDTLAKIAQAHGTTIKVIRALNQLRSDQLIVGKTLKLPAPTATLESSRGPSPTATSSNPTPRP